MRNVTTYGNEVLIVRIKSGRVIFAATMPHPEHATFPYSYSTENGGGGGSRDSILIEASRAISYYQGFTVSGILADDLRAYMRTTATISPLASSFVPRNVRLETMVARDGYAVTFAGFAGIEFNLHPSDDFWAIAEASTGIRICDSCKSKDAVLASAERTIKAHGLDALKRAIASTLERIQDRDAHPVA